MSSTITFWSRFDRIVVTAAWRAAVIAFSWVLLPMLSIWYIIWRKSSRLKRAFALPALIWSFAQVVFPLPGKPRVRMSSDVMVSIVAWVCFCRVLGVFLNVFDFC